jgi:ubiquinone/menaquinone biosynthesis C-methylase UbiE
MSARDPHRFSSDLDQAATASLIDRLENRAKDEIFTNLLEKYLDRIARPSPTSVLDIGCGTGVVLRRLARHSSFKGDLHGVDQCPPFIDAALRLAAEEGHAERISFRVGDAHPLDFPSESLDRVIAHTVISHVSEPSKVLREMARVVRRDGMIIVFDGDYASLTYGFPDHGIGQQMDAALVNATFNNPRIMRDLPRLLPDLDLVIAEGWGDAVTEIGTGSYFRTFAETYVSYVQKSGTVSADSAQGWLNQQLRAMDQGAFFAS